jgi:acyl phosphate:glycerol-3-phosphate acyltransferase
MDLGKLLIASSLGYLFGCFQTAFILGKAVGKLDIRKHGSFNAGASNATIVLGWKYGIITAVVDIFKGTLAVLLIRWIFKGDMNLMLATGAFAILGHNYPFYMNFEGGKGTASLLGMLLAVDYRLALIAAAVLIIVTLVTDYIALGTIVMYLVIVTLSILYKYSMISIGFISFLAILGISKHLVNVKRIITKEETSLRSTMKKK